MSHVRPGTSSGPGSSHAMPMEVLGTHLFEPPGSDEIASLQRVLSVSDQTAHNEPSTAALTTSSRSRCIGDTLLADVPDLEWLTDLQGLVQTAPHSGTQACATPQGWVSDSLCPATYPKPL